MIVITNATKRPPVDETANFLQTLLANHGPNYLEKLFGSKARDALLPLGGVQKVAIALSGKRLMEEICGVTYRGLIESETLDDFGKALHLMRSDLDHLKDVFLAVENGDLGLLKSLGIKDTELADLKFFLDKLVDTGFMD
ncbi:low-density lipoprotein receptor-like protein [Leptotrombidium deliense]|uniref:Low-density lipoprotein receptor-like protein n=1 Tax=Leptotrombidium deliense TaxID=299467 RepID=A0A443S401_9ACAR|nr:low-density lipoprotein receptor-like protein [Leptotrombidium deliense]